MFKQLSPNKLLSRWLKDSQHRQYLIAVVAVFTVAIVGTILLTDSRAAAPPYISVAADSGKTASNSITKKACSSTGVSGSNCATPKAPSSSGNSVAKRVVGGAGASSSPACTDPNRYTTVAAAANALKAAPAGSVICITAGNYTSQGLLSLSGTHGASVTIEPDPAGGDPKGAGKVTLAGVNISGTNITVHNFYSIGGINVSDGSSNDVIDHNDVTNGPGGAGVSVFCGITPCSAITINGNRVHNLTGTAGSGSGSSCSSYGGDGDAIRLDGWKSVTNASGAVITPGVTVTNNEITAIEQLQTSSLCEGHTDCLQSYNVAVTPSSTTSVDIIFNNNYEHDDNCQAFFLKDKIITSASLSENLFVRNANEGLPATNIIIFDTEIVTMDHNTSWAGTGDTIRSNTPNYQARLTNNVLQIFANGCSSCSDGKLPYIVAESNDIKGGNPVFMNTATDDYRLASNPNNVGINWRPADQVYGPKH